MSQAHISLFLFMSMSTPSPSSVVCTDAKIYSYNICMYVLLNHPKSQQKITNIYMTWYNQALISFGYTFSLKFDQRKKSDDMKVLICKHSVRKWMYIFERLRPTYLPTHIRCLELHIKPYMSGLNKNGFLSKVASSWC